MNQILNLLPGTTLKVLQLNSQAERIDRESDSLINEMI